MGSGQATNAYSEWVKKQLHSQITTETTTLNISSIPVIILNFVPVDKSLADTINDVVQ